MRNFVVKNDFNRGGWHKSAKDYSRSWKLDWGEIEPPKVF